MFWIWAIAGFLLLVLAVFLGLSSRFAGQVATIERQILTPVQRPSGIANQLPAVVQTFVRRANIESEIAPRGVVLHQKAELRMSPTGRWFAIAARQVIATTAPGFCWLATRHVSGLPVLRVLDAYVGREGLLRVRLLGGIPVVDAAGSDLDRGEAMRYLAELPWAPDAILHNPRIEWRIRPDDWVEAALDLAGGRVQVAFRFNAEGDIAEMFAADRPARLPDGTVEMRDWRGLFFDYAEMGGRRIPMRGEVGYVTGGTYAPYWRGTITGYEVVQ